MDFFPNLRRYIYKIRQSLGLVLVTLIHFSRSQEICLEPADRFHPTWTDILLEQAKGVIRSLWPFFSFLRLRILM